MHKYTQTASLLYEVREPGQHMLIILYEVKAERSVMQGLICKVFIATQATASAVLQAQMCSACVCFCAQAVYIIQASAVLSTMQQPLSEQSAAMVTFHLA